MLSFGHSFISDHIGTDNQYCLLLLSKTWVKTKSLGCTNNTKWKKMNFKNLITKLTRYYFHDIIIKLENFGIYKISIGKKIAGICSYLYHFTRNFDWSIYFFSLLCKNQIWFLWFFTYGKNMDFTQCCNTH